MHASYRHLFAIAIAAVVVLVASAAAAQEAPPRGVAKVFVQTTDAGEELRGHLLDLGPTGVTLLVDGVRRTMPIESVLKVQSRGDKVWDGALIGAAIGAVAFALVASEYGNAAIPGGLFVTGVWASFGAGVDALIPGRTTLYQKAPRDSLRAAAPGAAIGMKIRF